MLEKLLKMYYACMLQDVRSPTPHLAGPPGVGKSSVVQELANTVGCRLHKINVSRVSPLEIEGVQMPVDGNTRLELLLSTLWSELKEGDIVVFDEFLRGFPEVYNGLLDIITDRMVGSHQLPKVFFIAASNSVATYDSALEDRLLHIMVPDLRVRMSAREEAKDRLVKEMGLYPEVKNMPEMVMLFEQEILPTYKVMDQFTGGSVAATAGTSTGAGKSMRNLIGQVRLREVQSAALEDLITVNNRLAIQAGKCQYVVLLNGRKPDPEYVRQAEALQKVMVKLTEIQRNNLTLNLQLIEMEEALRGASIRKTTGEREESNA